MKGFFAKAIALMMAALLLAGCKEKEVREYYLIKFTPPVEQVGIYETTMSDPKCEIAKCKTYENDSIAIKQEAKKFGRWQNDLLAKFDKEVVNAPAPSDLRGQIKAQSTRNAYMCLLAEERTLMSVIHKESFDNKEFLSLIKKKGMSSDEVEEYIQEKGIQVVFYPIFTE